MNRRGFLAKLLHLGALAVASPLVSAVAPLPPRMDAKVRFYLRRSEWIELDRMVLHAARRALREWADLQAGVRRVV